MNKSFVTNSLAILTIVLGYYSPIYSKQIFTSGCYAFSGAITNWLAIHMLFEKVPGLYGSGVIPSRFEDFKIGIKNLMMKQFFTKENIQKFLSQGEGGPKISSEGIKGAIDFDKLFNDLLKVIMESQFGGMLGMFGGVQALEPLRDPFAEKMSSTIDDITTSEKFLSALGDKSLGDGLSENVENIVEQRLEELTPKMVKEIIQEMIHQHLGWLVVWGGVFGALIGLIASTLS